MTSMTDLLLTPEPTSVDRLRDLFPIGSTVQTKLLHVSRSGMLRSFAVLVPTDADTIRDVSHLVADAIGVKIHRPTGGVAMGGCGMDMGFALAYSLSRELYRDGFPCIGEGTPDRQRGVIGRCPANDHVNERTPDYTSGRMHSDPGYALTHRHI